MKEKDRKQIIVQEDFPADNLRDLIQAEKLNLESMWEIFGAIAEAVAYANRHGLIHRAVEPRRVWVRRQSQDILTKVDGFGTAYVQIWSLPDLESTAYFSPENARGERVTRACDVYSLGVILYEFLTGRRPFQADSIPKLIDKIIHAPVPWHGLSEPVRSVLEKCLQKAPGG